MWGKIFFFVNEKPQAVSGKGSLFFYPQEGKECFTYHASLRGFADVNPKLADNYGGGSWRRATHASCQFGVSRVGTRHRPRSWEDPLLSPSSPAQRGATVWTVMRWPHCFLVSGYFWHFAATLMSTWQWEWVSPSMKFWVVFRKKFPFHLSKAKYIQGLEKIAGLQMATRRGCSTGCRAAISVSGLAWDQQPVLACPVLPERPADAKAWLRRISRWYKPCSADRYVQHDLISDHGKQDPGAHSPV